VTYGRLVIRSRPSGARVEVNGRARGTTPLTLDTLPLASVTVRVTRSGYQPVQRRVTLSAAKPADTIDAALERATAARQPARRESASRFTGTVLFDSRPTGVRVYLDNTFIGLTPLQVADVRAGSHAVRFEKDGYRRWTAAVQINAGERNRVAASLEEAP
jgi:hypothetical protein